MIAPAQDNWRYTLAILLVLFGCLLRLVWPEADPDFYSWEGYIIDEGRWIENARRLFLFDELLTPSANVHLIVAPIYQALSLLLFTLLDISRWTVRLLPAVCGCLLLILLWQSLRQRLQSTALVFATALLVSQEDLLILSRIGIPEVPAMLLESAAFLTLLSGRSAGRAFLAGVLTIGCLGMKATTAPIAVVFGLIAWITAGPGWRTRSRRMLAFYAPILAGLVTVVTAGYLADLQLDLGIIFRFIRLSDPLMIVYFFFSNPMSPTIYLWLLPAWACLAVVLAAPSQIDRSLLKWWTASAVWALSYLPLAAVLGYFPDRYLAHVVPPLAMFAAFSVQILIQAVPADTLKAYDRARAFQRIYIAAAFALPAAVCLAAPASWFLSLFDLDFQRMRWQIPIIIVWWTILTSIVMVFRLRSTGLTFIFPVAFSALWFAGHQLFEWRFWNGIDGVAGGIQWIILLGLATVVTLWLARIRTPWGGPAIVVSSGAFLVFSLVPVIGGMTPPTSTIPDTSREIATVLAGEEDIVSHEAEGLFVDNNLPYESHYRRSWSRDLPEFVVSFELPGRPVRFPAARYEAKNTYDLYVSKRYSDGPAKVVIYRLLAATEEARKNDRL